jgi:hypothetical protein
LRPIFIRKHESVTQNKTLFLPQNLMLVLVLVLLSLGSSLTASQPAGSRLEPADDDVYTVVSRIDEGDSVVAVVRRNGVLHLLYDETIIGAEFDDPYLRTQTAFPRICRTSRVGRFKLGWALARYRLSCGTWTSPRVGRACQAGAVLSD